MRPLQRIITVSAITSLLFLGLVILSGWGLAGSYVPSLTDAFPSTLYMEKYRSGGHLLRRLHYYSSYSLVFLYQRVRRQILQNLDTGCCALPVNYRKCIHWVCTAHGPECVLGYKGALRHYGDGSLSGNRHC